MRNANLPPDAAPFSRVTAGDDRTHYDTFAIGLHWATAALILIQFVLAETWDFVPKPGHHLMVVSHMTFGILLSAVLIVRIAWRWIPGHQVRAADSGIVELASKAMHYLLYTLLVAEAVLGFLVRWSGGEAMSFFGILIPSPFEAFSKPVHHSLGEAHEFNGWLIIALAFIHALAALYHHYVLRDDLLNRMLPKAG